MSELDIDAIKEYGAPLTGKYKHFCRDFDGLPIDETKYQFQYCLCFEDSVEVKRLKDAFEESQ